MDSHPASGGTYRLVQSNRGESSNSEVLPPSNSDSDVSSLGSSSDSDSSEIEHSSSGAGLSEFHHNSTEVAGTVFRSLYPSSSLSMTYDTSIVANPDSGPPPLEDDDSDQPLENSDSDDQPLENSGNLDRVGDGPDSDDNLDIVNSTDVSPQTLVDYSLRTQDSNDQQDDLGVSNKSDDTVEQRCREVIEYGSPFEAFHSQFVEKDDLLTAIVMYSKSVAQKPAQQRIRIDMRLMITYRVVCTMFPLDQQYLEGEHFLSKVVGPQYGLIYLISGGDPDLPATKSDDRSVGKDEGVSLTSVMIDSLTQIARKTPLYSRVKTVCSGDNMKPLQNGMVPTAIMARFNLIASGSFFNEWKPMWACCAINTDWFDIIKKFDKTKVKKFVVNRCRVLKRSAPLYWESVAKKNYYSILDRWNVFKTRDINNAILLSKVFPDKFDPTVFSASLLDNVIGMIC